MSDYNFKVRCVQGNSYFTRNKIYEVVDGVISREDGNKEGFFSTIGVLNSCYENRFELVEEEQKQPVQQEQKEQQERLTPFQYLLQYLGVEEGEEFNLKDDAFSPYQLKGGCLVDREDDEAPDGLRCLLTGKLQIEKLPWKPKNGDMVYYVSPEYENVSKTSFFDKSVSSLALYKNGWLFKTKEEAEAEKERVLKECAEVLGSVDE